MHLADQVAIVTGAGSGIGREIAQRFAADGATVIVVDVDSANAQQTADDVSGAQAIPTDVTDRQSVQRVAHEVLARYGRIDVLVNNAGVCTGGTILDITDQQWHHDIDVSLRGTFLCSQVCSQP